MSNKPITPVELNPFCSVENVRDYLHRPFTSGDHTYATNGHILVRVPAIEGVNGCVNERMNVSVPEVFNDIVKSAEARMTFLNLKPTVHDEDCESCGGTGVKHDCTCYACGGSGGRTEKWPIVKIGEACFDGKYVALMQTFGPVSVGEVKFHRPVTFYFDGGEGMLMPYNSDRYDVEAELQLLS